MYSNLEGRNLIFLISQPRAGSTLLQLMLSGSPEIATTSEPWISLHPFFALRKIGVDSVYNSQLAQTALLNFLKESGMNISSYKRLIASLLTSLYDQAMNHQEKKYFLDKTPRYYHIIDELLDLFPKAKFIILFRNPLAVLNSILKTWVKDDLPFLCNYIEDLMVAPQKLVNCVKLYPERCYKIQYEDFITEPVKALKDICRFLLIEYSENMINYGRRVNPNWRHGDKVGVFKASHPIIDPIDKWKKGFETAQTKLLAISYLESLGPTLIKEMGYNFEEIYSSLKLPIYHKRQDQDLVSWSNIMNIIEGLSDIKDIRRAAFCVLIEDGLLHKGPNFEPVEWSDVVKRMVVNIVRPKINNLEAEINELKVERNAFKRERDDMINTLSWRVTAPVRNSKALNKIIQLLKNRVY